MADEDRITRAARALCVADGNDPETLIELGGETVDVGDVAWQRESVAPA